MRGGLTFGCAVLIVALALLLPARQAEARGCAGDCDRDGRVVVSELLTGVGLALGGPAGTTAALASSAGGRPCPYFDTDRNRSVGIAELVLAVRNAFDGCRASDFCGDFRAGVEAEIDALLPQMTLAEKIAQMHGERLAGGLWHTPDNDRLGIPGFDMVDGPRGVSIGAGNATAFPVGMARGATWNVALEERVGEAIGAEVRAKGGSVLLAPTINLLRHPRWGRAQETYGEDPLHLGAMGVGFIRGAQRHVVASAKHFALNSIEDTRFTVSVSADERTLREVYLPHFRMAVEDGHVGSVMSAYNRVNGLYSAENPPLLRDILKGDWGFLGFVESDWILGTRSTIPSALAGLDIEMPQPIFYGNRLRAAVEAGDVPERVIDEAVRRVLRVKLCFHLGDDPPVIDPDVVESPEHTALAREVAREAVVLLKNEAGALPIDPAAVQSIAVVGALAATANIGDRGSSLVGPSYVVTSVEGILNHVPPQKVVELTGVSFPLAAEPLVRNADAAVVVAGFTADDEGEGLVGAGDRKSLALPAEQVEEIRRVAELNRRVIVVLQGGASVAMEDWVDDVEAVLMAWYPGQEGGNAIADVLFGNVNPSGKLPVSFPREEADLPPFVNDSDEVEYGYYHGYRHLDREQIAPRFPFGFGLSYTRYEYANLALSTDVLAPDGTLVVSFDLTNSGTVAGKEIAQLYVGYEGSRADRPVRDLKGFAKVHLESGETKRVSIPLRHRNLAFWNSEAGDWEVEAITYVVQVGSSSRDLPLVATFTVDQTAGDGSPTPP
jgi:beta-glucosidase